MFRQSEKKMRVSTGWSFRRGSMLALLSLLAIGTFAGVSAAKEKPKLRTLTVAYGVTQPNFSEIGLFYALNHGLFTKYGLNVKFLFVNGDTLAMQALISGNADVSWYTNQLLYKSIISGAKVKGFIEADPVQDYELVAKSKIKTVPDMAGHVLGTSGPGGIAEVLPFAVFREKGLDPSKVRTINVGGTSRRLKALAGGVIDAGMAHIINTVRFMSKAQPGKFHVLSNFGKDLPHFQFGVFVARKKTFDTRMKDLVGFSKALMEGTRIVAKNEAAAIAEYRRYSKDLSDQQLHDVYVALKDINMFAVNGGMEKPYFDYTMKVLLDAKILKKKLKYTDAYDTRVRDAALKAIGTASMGK